MEPLGYGKPRSRFSPKKEVQRRKGVSFPQPPLPARLGFDLLAGSFFAALPLPFNYLLRELRQQPQTPGWVFIERVFTFHPLEMSEQRGSCAALLPPLF